MYNLNSILKVFFTLFKIFLKLFTIYNLNLNLILFYLQEKKFISNIYLPNIIIKLKYLDLFSIIFNIFPFYDLAFSN